MLDGSSAKNINVRRNLNRSLPSEVFYKNCMLFAVGRGPLITEADIPGLSLLNQRNEVFDMGKKGMLEWRAKNEDRPYEQEDLDKRFDLAGNDWLRVQALWSERYFGLPGMPGLQMVMLSPAMNYLVRSQ